MRVQVAVLSAIACTGFQVASSASSCPEIRILSTATNSPLYGSRSMTLLVARTGGEFFQWFRDGQPLADDPFRVQGSSQATLFVSGFTPRDQGLYHVEISDSCGNKQSSAPEFISIGCVADLDGDERIDDRDFSYFVEYYGQPDCPSGSPCAFLDFTADGLVDDSDFAIFAIQYDTLICSRP
jgi:hypothetical protein